MKTVRRPPYPKWNPGYFPCSSLTPLPLSSRRPSVSFGGFGLRKVTTAYRRIFMIAFIQRGSEGNQVDSSRLSPPVDTRMCRWQLNLRSLPKV